MEDQKLMDYFKFDESDLQANRNSNYSEAQKKRLFKGLFAPKKYFFYKVQGPISIEPYTLDYHAAAKVYYSLHVGTDKEFRVNKDLLDIVTKGDVYAVYYCNATQSAQKGEDSWDKVLSVEFISKGPSESEQADSKAGSPQKRLEELKNMHDANLISEQEFEQKKKEILDQV